MALRFGSAAGPDRHGLPSLGKSLSRCGEPVTSRPRYHVECGSANEPFRLAMRGDDNGALRPPRRQGGSGGGTAQVRRAHKDFLSEADLCRRPAAVDLPTARPRCGQPVTGKAYFTTLSFGGPFGPGVSSSPPSLPDGGSPSVSVKIMPSPDSRA